MSDIDDLADLDFVPSDSEEEDHVEVPVPTDEEVDAPSDEEDDGGPPVLALPGPIVPSGSAAAPTLSLPPASFKTPPTRHRKYCPGSEKRPCRCQ